MHKISYPEKQSAKKIREIKLQIILLFLSVCGISSSAQIEPALCNLPKGLEVSYIDVRDQSTRIYFDYTMPDDSAWLQSMKGLSVSRNAYLSVEGEPVRPRLISAINIPVDCEAVRAAMVSDKPSQRHRFILEFEKLPDGCRAFDLIGDEGGFGAINIKNVPVNRADSVEVPAIRSYLSGYPLKEYGRYYSDGVLVSYVKCNEIIVNSVADIVSAYGKYINVQIYVQNLRDEPILLKPGNISAKALCASDTKTKNSDRMSEKAQSPDAEASTRRPVYVEILSCQEYDKIVGKKQHREQFWFSVISGAVTVANVYAYDSSQSDLVLYESNRRYDEYRAMKASNEQIRHQFGQDYVKTHTIPGGTDYSGFFNMKFNKNMNELEYSVLIDGETYTFNVSVQSDSLVPLPFFDSLSL